MRKIVSKIRYWLAWKLAGQRIWNEAVMWAATHIYLYSAMGKISKITLPEGITLADETITLASGMTLDGAQHILTDAINKPLGTIVQVLPDAEDVTIVNTVIIGHENIQGSAPSTAIKVGLQT